MHLKYYVHVMACELHLNFYTRFSVCMSGYDTGHHVSRVRPSGSNSASAGHWLWAARSAAPGLGLLSCRMGQQLDHLPEPS